VRTLVISDLHLGGASRTDLLRRPDLREPLLEALDQADRLVVLGDVLELREVPVRAAAAHAEGFLRDVARTLGRSKQLVLLAGNHDHGLVAPWLDARLYDPDGAPLQLEHRFTADEAGPLARRLAEHASDTEVLLAYPGLFVRDDVYAIHGHYADVHTTVPTFERLAAGAMGRFAAQLPGERATPDDYEAVLAPLYAWMLAHAQRDDRALMSAGAGHSARVYRSLTDRSDTRRRVVGAATAAGFAAAVGAINKLGLGPVTARLDGPALRQGYLRGMREVIRRLDVRTTHLIWGHSHRAGPFPGDDDAEWTAATGTRILNTGSWVYQRHFLSAEPNEGPYWPGTAVEVPESGPPRLRRLLGDRGHALLAPPPA
jgi:hypothetical protein